MPIYEFTCGKCDKDFEELVRSARDRVACPSCGSKRVKRAMSSFSYASGGRFRHASGDGCGDCSKGSCSSCRCGGH